MLKVTNGAMIRSFEVSTAALLVLWMILN